MKIAQIAQQHSYTVSYDVVRHDPFVAISKVTIGDSSPYPDEQFVVTSEFWDSQVAKYGPDWLACGNHQYPNERIPANKYLCIVSDYFLDKYTKGELDSHAHRDMIYTGSYASAIANPDMHPNIMGLHRYSWDHIAYDVNGKAKWRGFKYHSNEIESYIDPENAKQWIANNGNHLQYLIDTGEQVDKCEGSFDQIEDGYDFSYHEFSFTYYPTKQRFDSMVVVNKEENALQLGNGTRMSLIKEMFPPQLLRTPEESENYGNSRYEYDDDEWF